MALQDFEDFGVADATEVTVGENGANGLAIGSGAALESVNDGERCLTLAQVGGDRFAEDVFGGGEVEDIVDDLEGEAEIAAVFAELLFEQRRTDAEVMAAPSCMETLKRYAVLR